MAGFLSRLFGSKKTNGSGEAEDIVKETLDGIIERAGLELVYEVSSDDEKNIHVELSGADEGLVLDRRADLMDAIQLLLLRVLQHRYQEERVDVTVDCGNFQKQANDALIEMAEKLRDKAITSNKTVYFRALPPKERKIVHQFLASDGRVKSRSVGDGMFKRIKVFPVKGVEADSQ